MRITAMVTDREMGAHELSRAFGPGSGLVRFARAPYRLSPLGAHTDHQEGWTCGFALDRVLVLAFRPAPGNRVRLRSRELAGDCSFELDMLPDPSGHWGDRPVGVARVLREAHPEAVVRGVEALVFGELPPGGVSSSAALEVAVLLALAEVNRLRLDPEEAIHLVVRAEHASTGVQVGLLDPAVILNGRAGCLVVIDCREGKPRPHRLARSFPTFELLLVDAGVPRDLRDSPYNERVEDCRRAARQAGALGERPVLRDVDAESFRRARARGEIDPVAALRAEHVFAENKRVKLAMQALATGDLLSFGHLVTASGESLARGFGCGLPETLDLLSHLKGVRGVLGASFAGSGFGGLLQAVAQPGTAALVESTVLRSYRERFPEAGGRAAVYAVGVGGGAHVL